MKQIYEKYKNTQPNKNPIDFQFSDKYKGPVLGDGGKLFFKRERMNDITFHDYDESYYAVPAVWKCPQGFRHDGYTCWRTDSEIIALRHYREYGHAQNKLKKKFDPIIQKQDELYKLSRAIDCNAELPKGVKSTFVPRPHQKIILPFLELSDKNYVCIFDGMRSGKSITSLLLVLKKEFKTILIVCPAMLKNVWEGQINSLIENAQINFLNSGDEIQKNSYNICSYDILHTIDADVDCCILDEIHYVAQADSRRTNALMNIKAQYKCGLSGTPILNKPSEILPILEWLDKDLFKEIKLFLDNNVNLDPYLLSKNLSQELRRRCALQRETSKLSDGGKTFTKIINIECDLPENATLKQIGEFKIPYAVEYCRNYKDDKIIVAVQHLDVARKFVSSMGDEAVVITGETPQNIRKSIQEAFTNNKRVLCGSSAISEGLDFSFSSRIVFIESGYSFRTEQLRRRAERVGKTQSISVDILVANHKKDKRIMEVLEKKYSLNYGFND